MTTTETKLRKWHANTDGTVYAIATTASRVYVGGSFNKIKGSTRHRLAALGTTSTSPLQGWHPNANSTVRALVMSPGGGRVFAGGDFTAINGKARPHLAALNTTTGGATVYAAHPTWPVTALRTTATALVAGGGGNGGHIAEYASTNGARRWLVVTDGDVQGLAISGSTVFVGGHFNNFCRGGTGTGNPLTCNAPTPRRKLLGLTVGKGLLTGWDPDAVGSTVGVSAVSAGGGGVQAGGAFTKVHGDQPAGHRPLQVGGRAAGDCSGRVRFSGGVLTQPGVRGYSESAHQRGVHMQHGSRYHHHYRDERGHPVRRRAQGQG